MFKDTLLEGKRILVTGGGSGLGKEMASEYAKLGAEVYICGRRKSVLDDTVKEITDAGGKAKAHACDIRVSEAINSQPQVILLIDVITLLLKVMISGWICLNLLVILLTSPHIFFSL